MTPVELRAPRPLPPDGATPTTPPGAYAVDVEMCALDAAAPTPLAETIPVGSATLPPTGLSDSGAASQQTAVVETQLADTVPASASELPGRRRTLQLCIGGCPVVPLGASAPPGPDTGTNADVLGEGGGSHGCGDSGDAGSNEDGSVSEGCASADCAGVADGRQQPVSRPARDVIAAAALVHDLAQRIGPVAAGGPIPRLLR